jgi:hypothetical protein
MLADKVRSASSGSSRTPTAIALAHDTTPYVSAYPWSGSGFGTK